MTDFEALYHDYFRDVYLYTLSLSGNKQIAEDMTAETFLKAIQAIDTFNGSCDIRVWLCQIAKNTYFSYLRKNNKMIPVEQMPENESTLNLEKNIQAKESSMEIHQLIHDLSEPYKEVFTLRTFGELSFKEIGMLFQKNDNWACVTYHRARKKLVEKWRDKNENNL